MSRNLHDFFYRASTTSGLAALLFAGLSGYGQRKITALGPENPPRPVVIYVNPAQGLIFGAFYQGGTGGTVIVYPNGSRSTTGSVIQTGQGFSFSPAIFEIDAEPGTLITIVNGPDVTLTGSNGEPMNLHLDDADPTSPFIATTTSPGRTQVRIGGTLTLTNPLANPPGNYSGIFSVTFIQP